MANFTCRDKSNNVIASWPETTIRDDIRRCSQLVLEQQNRVNLNVADRKVGDSAKLSGRWTDSSTAILASNDAAPELNQEVIFEPFPDRHAHSVIYNTWAQRGDFVYGISEDLDYEDQIRFQQRLIRDLTATVRALSGDIIDLQTRLGESMQRIDNLEQWNRFGDENEHDLPGLEIQENPSMFPLPPAPYYIGNDLISDEEEQLYYHQGYHVGGVEGGLRRYYAAQEARGISAPPVSPLVEADENTGRFERYDQSTLGPDGYPACRKGETRDGFGRDARCVAGTGSPNPPDFPTPVNKVIPIVTTPFYKVQAFGTGLAVVIEPIQKIYPITLGNEFLLSSDDDEVYYNTANPLCIPHTTVKLPETDPTQARLQPKCFKAPEQQDPFFPMGPILGLDLPCGPDEDTEFETCPEPLGISDLKSL